MKVAIVGGGVAGLAIGWRLAETGANVEIFEKGVYGRAATWAAAGMLASAAETGAADDPPACLAREGRRAWPEFARDIEKASGIGIGFRKIGALMVASDDAKAHEYIALGEALRQKGEDVRWLSRDDAQRIEPCLTGEFSGALFLSDAAQVDNRALGPALGAAFLKAGGRLHETCEVRTFSLEDGRVNALATSAGIFEADRVVVAAGAWTNSIGGVPPEALPPVRPCKGQMTALAPPECSHMPRHIVVGDDVYLVPRRDTLLIGATVEDCGFDASVNRTVRDELVASAIRLIPNLRNWPVGESWAGFRPRARDDMPVLGATSVPGLFVASGQFRNGILFAPTVADILRDCVIGRPTAPFTRAFDPRRFLQA